MNDTDKTQLLYQSPEPQPQWLEGPQFYDRDRRMIMEVRAKYNELQRQHGYNGPREHLSNAYHAIGLLSVMLDFSHPGLKTVRDALGKCAEQIRARDKRIAQLEGELSTLKAVIEQPKTEVLNTDTLTGKDAIPPGCKIREYDLDGMEYIGVDYPYLKSKYMDINSRVKRLGGRFLSETREWEVPAERRDDIIEIFHEYFGN